MDRPRLTAVHKLLIAVIVVGEVVIASIGFVGSYQAVRQLALDHGFGAFANVFPIGIDAGIIVLLALDLLLTWLRIPVPILRQIAWLLTAATVFFNATAAWPDPVGTVMHAVMPVLFIGGVEAARIAIGQTANITAGRHMEAIRPARWLLALPSTFRMWRLMKLWEVRSYQEVVRREQDRMVYRARLRAKYGPRWKRRAAVEELMPLRLAKYGVPVGDSAPGGTPDDPPEPVPPAEPRPVSAAPADPAAERVPVTLSLEKEPAPAPRNPEDDTEPVPESHDGADDHAGRDDATAPHPLPAARAAALEIPRPHRRTVSPANGHARIHPEPPAPTAVTATLAGGLEGYAAGYRTFVAMHHREPTRAELSQHLYELHGLTGRSGKPISPSTLGKYWPELQRQPMATAMTAGAADDLAAQPS